MTQAHVYQCLPPEPADAILERVLAFRGQYDQYARPDDVNTLLTFFPQVRLEEGYLLDYVLDSDAEGVQRIVPFARRRGSDGAPDEPPPGNAAAAAALPLEPWLHYEHTPQGLFEYAFFLSELRATRASWHAAEWLASTPIFTEARFDTTLARLAPPQELKRPAWFGPQAELAAAGGWVRFLVYTETGWERIYFLEIEVDEEGRIDQQAGMVVADFGLGMLF
ncbi:MAG: hypothetical protein WDA75_14835 [Candidatus Latescibacterota bacterium]|jgi:hypothetical protein